MPFIDKLKKYLKKIWIPPVILGITVPIYYYEELQNVQSQVIRSLRKNPNLSRIESDYSLDKPEVKLLVNNNKAKASLIVM